MKLKCVLLDDELPGLTYLKMICDQISTLDVVKAYNQPDKFVREYQQLEFDLCILDIEMPTMSGLEIAAVLKGKLVIFTTAYKQYATHAFDLNAVDYVVKPVQRERLEQAVRKALIIHTSASLPAESVQFNTDQGKALIPVDHIALITVSEVDSRDKLALLRDGSTRLLKNISFEAL